jgi:hypothetical protein
MSIERKNAESENVDFKNKPERYTRPVVEIDQKPDWYRRDRNLPDTGSRDWSGSSWRGDRISGRDR